MGDLIARLRIEGPRVWRKLSAVQRASLIGVALATVAAVIFLANWAQQTEYSTLFAKMNETDAAAVVAKLKDLKIPYELADGGATIKVPSDKVYDVRLQLASEGLPASGPVGYELFDRTNFGLTDFVQKINYQRALEGELDRTIASLSAVQEARVHIAIPQSELFTSQQNPTTASVVLLLKPGQQLDARQVRGVVNLVAGSVTGLKPENVTVLDGNGITLSGQSGPSELAAGVSTTQRDAQRAYEQSLQNNIQAMLEQVLGPRKAVVRVAATMDWNRQETSTETYSPPGAPTPQVLSSHSVTELSSVPLSDGSLSTPSYPLTGLPVGPVSPNATPAATQGAQATPSATATPVANMIGSVSNPKYERKDTTTNYEISKQVEKTVKAPGSVKRLSVSVLLDGQLDSALTTTITKAVTAAAGLDTTRGDTVVVASLPFDHSAATAADKASQDAAKQDLYMEIAKGALVVFSLLVVLLLVRSVIKGLTRDPNALPKEKGKKGKKGVPQLPEGVSLEQALAMVKATPKEDDPRPAQVLKDVTQLAEAEPQLLAQIVKSWLDEKG